MRRPSCLRKVIHTKASKERSSDNKDEVLIATLNQAKRKYSDAYIKSSKVYMCCVH